MPPFNAEESLPGRGPPRPSGTGLGTQLPILPGFGKSECVDSISSSFDHMNIIRLRILAVIFDIALLAGVAILCRELLLFLWPMNQQAAAATGQVPWSTLVMMSSVYLLVATLFYGCCAGVLRSSPGKSLLGLKVSAVDGQGLTFFQAMLREQLRLCELIFFISGFFSFLNILESRPTTTDSVFRTYVRDRRR